MCPLTYVAGRRGAAGGAGDRAVRRGRHVAGRDRDDAAGGGRRRSGSRARCSTMSGRRSSRRGCRASAAMSGGAVGTRPGCTPRARSRRATRDVYPDWELEDWLAMAKRLYRLNGAGRIVLDYDMKIAEPFRVPGNEAAPDMWRALDALAGAPVLVVRGERSDVLSRRRRRRGWSAALPRRELVTVPRRRPRADAGRAGGGRGDRPAAGAGSTDCFSRRSGRDVVGLDVAAQVQVARLRPAELARAGARQRARRDQFDHAVHAGHRADALADFVAQPDALALVARCGTGPAPRAFPRRPAW